jgi:hypothetical protein
MATPNQDQSFDQLEQEDQITAEQSKTGGNNYKLAFAGAATMVAEPLLALAHAGGVGVIVGLAIGGFTYWVCDEVEQARGKEISLPSASVPKRSKTPGQRTLLYRMLNGKSTRGEDGDPQSEQQTEEQARTTDKYILRLAPGYHPHINDILGHAILGVGQRGTGKSTLAARLIEQIGQHPVPAFIGDYKGDYVTLPEVLERCVIGGAPEWEGQRDCHLYWRVTKQNAMKAGALIMERGVQLVFECLTYETLDEACEIMIDIIKGMFTWSLKQPADQRIPALVLLDEAQQFLPQNQGDSRIDQGLSNQLFLMFEKLNSVGRTFGFTPAFFTQRIAQIRKEVIGGSELFFLMRQTLPQDLKGYEDLIGRDEHGKLRLDRRLVQKLGQGDGIVFTDGEFFVTHFDQRKSNHPSTTPELKDAIAFYGDRHEAPLTLHEMEPLATKSPQQQTAASERRQNTSDQQDQVYATIHKLLSLHEANKIDDRTLQLLLDAIPGSQTTSLADVDQQDEPQDEEEQAPVDMELERAINALREGATSINKLAAALDIKPYYAGPLLERAKKEIQKRQVING